MAAPPIGYNDPTIGGLVGWWTMNEGTGTVTTADLSGNGNTGYLTNSPAWTNGVVRSGLKFDGLTTGIGTSLNVSNYSQLTYCAWVKYAALPNHYEFFVTADGANGSGGFGLAMDNQNKIYCSCSNGYQGTTNSIVVNTWYFVCGSATNSKAGNVSLYINGVIKTDAASALITSVGNYTPLSIGRSITPVGFPNYTTATIDDVRIYNRALSSDEILKLYNGGYGSQK